MFLDLSVSHPYSYTRELLFSSDILASAYLDSLDNIVRPTSMSVSPTLVRMEANASTGSTDSGVNVPEDTMMPGKI